MTTITLEEYCATFARCLDKPMRLPAFIDIAPGLPDDVFWGLFRFIWTGTESAALHVANLRTVLTTARIASPARLRNHTDEERRYLATLRKRPKGLVRVYRGCSPANLAGFSWTLSKGKATEFALRYGNQQPIVISGRIHVDWVTQLYLSRGEKEVFCHPEDVKMDKRFDLKPRKRTEADVVGLVSQMFGQDVATGITEAQRLRMAMRLSGNTEDGRASARRELNAQIDRCARAGLVDRVTELNQLMDMVATWEYTDGE